MKSAFHALIIALVVVALLTPAVRVIAFRLGAVAHPGGRHVHSKSIPRLGGVGIMVGFFAPLLALYLRDAEVAGWFNAIPRRMLGLVVGALLMCAVGAVDDTRGVRALYKLFAQIGVAVFAYGCGFGVSQLRVPLLGTVDTWALAMPLTVLWIVGVVNAINLIDGLDGLAAGVVFFAATTNFVVAWLNGAPMVAVLSGATVGAVLGFLFYNWNPARIFMGDSGSYFLGYVLAITAIIGASQKASTTISLLVPMMALGVPIFDTLFAMIRRVVERRPVFSPDRGHIHHRLLDMGLTHRRAVIIIYAVCGVFTAAAIAVSLERTWQVGAALLAATVVMIGLVRFVGYFEYLHLRVRQRARIRSRDTEMLRAAVPELPRRLGGAESEDEIWDELWRFAGAADLGFIEVLEGDGTGERTALSWPQGFDADGAAVRDMVTASYPLGDGEPRATIRFGWRSDFGDVAPQSEILLQVATDLLAEHLVRVGSPLSPRASGEKAGQALAAAV